MREGKIKKMTQLKDGFYIAPGTPLDENGNLVADSLKNHIRQQIDAGALGLLLMGSMRMEKIDMIGGVNNYFIKF